jgi:acyl-coenzyme A synthetase/AMP-(fatty) acid ligase
MGLTESPDGVCVGGDHLPEAVLLQDRLNVLSATEFEFLSRAHDMLNVGGKRASLADLTEKVLAIDGVDDAVVFMPGGDTRRVERPAALVVSALSEQAIRREVSKTIDPVFAPRPLKKVSRLPRGEHGKLQRGRLLELLEQGHAEQPD